VLGIRKPSKKAGLAAANFAGAKFACPIIIVFLGIIARANPNQSKRIYDNNSIIEALKECRRWESNPHTREDTGF
jgi:hypothetical protein